MLMKRFILTVLALVTFCCVQASAQGFGVTAGMNFNSAKVKEVKMDARAGWNVGVTYGVDLPLGFSVQPALVFTQKGASISAQSVSLVQTVSSLELPVSLQWGPDLVVARPFIDVTPFVGYSLSNKAALKASLLEAVGAKVEGKGKNAFDYGLGVGAGVDLWKLRFVVRYNWNFGPLGSLKDFTGINLGDLKTQEETFGGIAFSLAYFF